MAWVTFKTPTETVSVNTDQIFSAEPNLDTPGEDVDLWWNAARQTLVAQALEIDEVVRTAVAENSLSPQSIEAAIRKGLLPLLFGKLGLDRAKEAVEQIVQITRLGLGKAP